MTGRGRVGFVLFCTFASSIGGCGNLTLTRVDRNMRFDRMSANAIVVFGFLGKFDVWLAAGVDDGVNWVRGAGAPQGGQQVWNLRPENGFVVARLPPRTGKYKYAIRQIGADVLMKYRPAANAPVWVFNAEPGRVSYIGAVRVVRSSDALSLDEDSVVTEKDADEFVTRTFPNITDHVVSRPMSWIYTGMNCR